MRFFNFSAGIAALAVGMAMMVQSAPGAEGFSNSFVPRRHKGKGQANRRGKGKRSKPKARPNRLHISKRVRRQHRRARAA